MKLDPKELDKIIEKYIDEYVVVGPKLGEDSAIIKIGEYFLAIHSDPITGTKSMVPWYALAVSTNDIAVSGIRPRWVLPVILAPNRDEAISIVKDLQKYARKLGVGIIGGHTEVTYGIGRPIVSCTAMGIGNSYVPTGGAKEGDLVFIVREAGIEGTAILAMDLGEEAIHKGVPRELVERAKEFLWEISLLEQAMSIKDLVNSMHDGTEGGVIQALLEISIASKKELRIKEIPIRRETKELCEAFGLNPFRITSSGTLVGTAPPENLDEIISRVERTGARVHVIGKVLGPGEGVYLEFEGREVREYEGEELDKIQDLSLSTSFTSFPGDRPL